MVKKYLLSGNSRSPGAKFLHAGVSGFRLFSLG